MPVSGKLVGGSAVFSWTMSMVGSTKERYLVYCCSVAQLLCPP